MKMIYKAQIKGAHTADLFAQSVVVAPHVQGGHVVPAYIAIRHKAPPEVKPTKVLVVHPEPIHAAASVESKPEPSHITEGRAILARYKQRLASRAARGLPGLGGAAMDETSMALWEKRLGADPAKWSVGQGVSYQVDSGGRHAQTNRGFRIVSIDAPGLRAVVGSVADTGITRTGGDHDRIDDTYVYLGELKRDRKYDRVLVTKPAA